MGDQETTTADARTERSADDVADLFYGSTESLKSMYGLQMKDATDRLTDAYGWSEAQRSEHETEWMHAFHDARIPNEPASTLYSLYAKYAEAPPDQATLEQWSAESRKHLRETYGPAEAARRVEAAQAFVKARPKLEAALHASGMRSHPAWVKALTESPHNMRMTPRPRASSKGGK
jgi:hypothetical protein